ncbi:MAG: uroporphyrinogen decarboxylase family protein, partial [Candidatus Acidiferrales bacterium]
RSDGLACYFDPFLEVEALGAELRLESDVKPPSVHWPQSSPKGEIPAGPRSPEEAVKCGRVPIALEVIRRLNSLLRDEFILMAGVTGPFTLAARLAQLSLGSTLRREDFSENALELAASTITAVSSALGEAGANVIFIREDCLPSLSAESCSVWASLLAPAINVIRFYGALPILQIMSCRSFTENAEVISRQFWDCIVCPTLEGVQSAQSENSLALRPETLGIAVPLEIFQADSTGDEAFRSALRDVISKSRPSLITTAGDVPLATDMKRMIQVLQALPREF